VATEPQRIEREILHTREQLGEDVDALVEKLDPRRVAAREVARARTSAGTHPRAVALAGVGVAVLLAGWLTWRLRHRH
jgi:hypothetical protein